MQSTHDVTQVQEKPRIIPGQGQEGQEEEGAEAVVSNVCDSVGTAAPAPAPMPVPAPTPVVEAPAAAPSNAAVSVAGHNLRPKRTLRHVSAMKQQGWA